VIDVLVPHPPAGVPDDGLPIGEAAAACGVSIDTLRYYEKADLLLEPAERDTAGRRRYHRGDLAWVAGLVRLRETGMPIADMRAMARLYRRRGTEAERLALLEQHRDRVIAEQQRIARHLSAIEAKICAYRVALAAGDEPAKERAAGAQQRP
jgi:DNA-binding transcriptional MerR regulator